jgi:hypothetical protein
MPQKGQKRDVTEALDLLKRETRLIVIDDGAGGVVSFFALTDQPRRELISILKNIDARTGRRDPSKRKAAKRGRR